MGIFKHHKSQFDKHLTNQLRETDPSDTAVIQTLLAQGADPNASRDHDKSSPLIQAASCGCIPTMEVLLNAGADVNKVAGYKWHFYPLMAAVYENQREAVEFLLNHGANPDGPKYGQSPLDAAIEIKNLDMMELLLSKEADPDKGVLGVRPTFAISATVCHHDIRKPPRPKCKKCGERLFQIRALALLRQYGARPLVEGITQGTGLVDAYIDLIAEREKWAERGERAGKWLAEQTMNDPMIQAMTKFMVGGALGAIGIPTPVTSLGDLFELPDFEVDPIKVEPVRPVEDRIFHKPPSGMMRYVKSLDSLDQGPKDPLPGPNHITNSQS